MLAFAGHLVADESQFPGGLSALADAYPWVRYTLLTGKQIDTHFASELAAVDYTTMPFAVTSAKDSNAPERATPSWDIIPGAGSQQTKK